MKPAHLLQIQRHFGTRWLISRASYAMKLRSGSLRRRLPLTDWTLAARAETRVAMAKPQELLARRALVPFFFQVSDRESYAALLAEWPGGAVKQAEEIASGVFRYFSHLVTPVGTPPDWHANPLTGQKAPHERHWSEIGDFECGDIKVIWELSRFGFVYPLVRAYWRTGDERHAETFWRLIEDWREKNLPQAGANWKCGQEIAFRVMAWCFGLHGFLDAKATTVDRVAQLTQMIAVSGVRIAANIDYALNQQNNHGISEAAGLWTIGTLFPELRSAQQWKTQGRVLLERLGRELIYDDGSFVQHSTNYHRLMLHAYLWALRLGDLHGEPFSAELRERVYRAGEFLFHLQEEASGSVPNYGHNDGALLLPLNECDYADYRPVVQAVHFLARGVRTHAPGPWDEDLLWLFGPSAFAEKVASKPREDMAAQHGGYFTLRSPASWVFTRCATFRHRPAQADMLHVDLSWRGHSIAIDAGTYSYHAPGVWDNALSRTRFHNTVEIDDSDQMRRAGRFLWLPWLRSRVHQVRNSPRGFLACWQGEHDGYQPAVHRRAVVRLGDEHWLVVDAIESEVARNARLHWLFADREYEWDQQRRELALWTPDGNFHVHVGAFAEVTNASLVRADEHSPRGWRSTHYFLREPALSLEMTAAGKELRFWTVLGPKVRAIETSEGLVSIETEGWRARVELGRTSNDPLIRAVRVSGEVEDALQNISQ